MKKFILYSFFTLVIFLVFLLFLEFAFRFFREESLSLSLTTGVQEANARMPFVPNQTYPLKSSKPGEYEVTVNINSHGLRGAEFSKEKKEGETRILMVGDSFTFGVGAEEDETIPYLTQKRLHEKGYSVEVINAGVGHTSPIPQYIKLRDYYFEFNPDFVVFLFDFSDLKNDWSYEKRAVFDEDGEILYYDPSRSFGKFDWWEFLVRNSSLCRWVHRKIVRPMREIKILGWSTWAKGMLQGERAKAMIANKMGSEKSVGVDTIQYDLYLMIRGRERLPQIEQHWKRTAKYLLRMRDLCAENNIPFLLGIYPYGVQVGPDQWNEGRIYWGFEPNKVYADRYAFDLIEDFADRNNLPLVNTLDDFLKNSERELYFPLDGHLNPEGNNVLAESLTTNPRFLKILQEIVPVNS